MANFYNAPTKRNSNRWCSPATDRQPRRWQDRSAYRNRSVANGGWREDALDRITARVKRYIYPAVGDVEVVQALAEAPGHIQEKGNAIRGRL